VSLNAALVDRARRLVGTPTPVRVEGTTQFQTLHLPWFRCRLTLSPAPESDDPQGARRRVPRPASLLIGLKDTDGNLNEVHADDKLEIDSKQLGRAVYMLTSDGEPIRKKKKLIGWAATATRVEEHQFMVAEP
jgi:hypothetical protein